MATWEDERLQELNNTPRDKWTEDDWDAFNYIQYISFERSCYDD